MRTWQGISVEAEGTGITEPLSVQINLVGGLLGHAIRRQGGQEIFDLVESLRKRCKAAAQSGDEAIHAEVRRDLERLDVDQILWLLRAYAALFHLVNMAERLEIARINREREREESPEAPRAESIAAAIHEMKERGLSLAEVLTVLGRLDIRPTLTAHPTEARRRSILFKQQRIAALLSSLGGDGLTPGERQAVVQEIYYHISLLLGTDEVRAERPTVLDEVEHGLHFCTSSIWETVPRIYEDVREAIETYYGETIEPPAFLRYRSWIGGDRDGNPRVTPDVTRQALRMHRAAALDLYIAELVELRRELSVSSRQVRVSDELLRSIEADEQCVTVDPVLYRLHRFEPYRLKVTCMIERLRGLAERVRREERLEAHPDAYGAAEFAADLLLLRRSLEASGLEDIAHLGRLSRLLMQARAFGFHLAALDLRQHSRVHEAAVAELLRVAGVTDDYAGLPEPERQRLLERELRNPRPLLPRHARLSDGTRLALETFEVMQEALAWDEGSIGAYIVSMTHEVSDLLEVILLAKEVGLWRLEGEEVRSRVDLVPLFETIDDLERAEGLVGQLFSDPIYRLHLRARGDLQEIMLGYSDSNKDGGYWMANWALHRAQGDITRACRHHGIGFRLFHGRGGTVGRGGGRANQAIAAMPPSSHNGQIRFTEQGEVISFRYALQSVAHRHLEQIVNAMLLVTPPDGGAVPDPSSAYEPMRPLMEEIAAASMEAYRTLIHDRRFWRWYTHATPIEQISHLPIASRPVSRKGASEVDFESLRAIPWVFAWTQTRYTVPGWYGLGVGLRAALDGGAERLALLRRMYEEWGFFRAVVNNAQREMARARLDVARHYDALAEGGFHEQIREEFERATDAILRITGQRRLLDNSPVIQKSISLRNPYTDVLNFLQIELVRRWREHPEARDEKLQHALWISINGLAAAMQSTG